MTVTGGPPHQVKNEQDDVCYGERGHPDEYVKSSLPRSRFGVHDPIQHDPPLR